MTILLTHEQNRRGVEIGVRRMPRENLRLGEVVECLRGFSPLKLCNRSRDSRSHFLGQRSLARPSDLPVTIYIVPEVIDPSL